MLYRSFNLHRFLRHPFSRYSNPKSLIPPTDVQKFSSICDSRRYYYAFRNPRRSIPVARFPIINDYRSFSVEIEKEVGRINLKFAVAREEIESAMESKETVYFNEEAECARAAVDQVLELYDRLLEKVQEKEKAAIQRSMGLKIEQLKAELQQLDD